MGTRADFYKKTGDKLNWMGSIGWDGHPKRIDKGVLDSKTLIEYEQALINFFGNRDDATIPSMGWPWPWDASNTTDHTYVFVKDKVIVDGDFVFPDMSKIGAVTYGERSGLLQIGVNK